MNRSHAVNGSKGGAPKGARRAKRASAAVESAEERRASIAASLEQLVTRDRARKEQARG